MAFSSGTSKKAIAEIIVSQLDADTMATVIVPIDPPVKYAIYVATDLELTSVLKRLDNVTRQLSGSVLVYSGTSRTGIRISAIKTGQGNSNSAAVVSATLKLIQPAAAIFSGISGALYDLPFGTVVIAEYVYDYESAEIGDKKAARSKSLAPNQRLLQIAGESLQQAIAGIPKIVMRPIASGEKLLRLQSGGEFEWVKLIASDAAVVEMEGLGFLRACEFADVPGLIVRSVSDHLLDKTAANDVHNQPSAAGNAATVAMGIIDSIEELSNSDAG